MSCPPSDPGMVYNAICPSLTEFIIVGVLSLVMIALMWYSEKKSGSDGDFVYECGNRVDTKTVKLEDEQRPNLIAMTPDLETGGSDE